MTQSAQQTAPQGVQTQETQNGPTTLFFDFLCPFAWRGSELAEVLRREDGKTFALRHYSLIQGNHPENPDRKAPSWWLTDQRADEGSDLQRDSLSAFLAAQAARRQGTEAEWRFTLALQRARHLEESRGGARGDLTDPAVLEGAAGEAGLDLERFRSDLQDDAGLRAALRADLEESARRGVFATPTVLLPSGDIAYFRFAQLTTEPQAARALWGLYEQVLHSGAEIGTIKRAK